MKCLHVVTDNINTPVSKRVTKSSVLSGPRLGRRLVRSDRACDCGS